MEALLHDTIAHWRSRDGQGLRVRPIRPEDAGLIRWGLDQLSPESLYQRFFSRAPRVPDAVVKRLSEPIPGREYAVLVVRREGEAEMPVAGGRFVAGEDGQSCEFAVTVGEEWRRQGLGRRILSLLIREARQRQIPRMEGYVLNDNIVMLGLVLSLGFRIEEPDPGDTFRRVALDLRRRGWRRLLPH